MPNLGAPRNQLTAMLSTTCPRPSKQLFSQQRQLPQGTVLTQHHCQRTRGLGGTHTEHQKHPRRKQRLQHAESHELPHLGPQGLARRCGDGTATRPTECQERIPKVFYLLLPSQAQGQNLLSVQAGVCLDVCRSLESKGLGRGNFKILESSQFCCQDSLVSSFHASFQASPCPPHRPSPFCHGATSQLTALSPLIPYLIFQMESKWCFHEIKRAHLCSGPWKL